MVVNKIFTTKIVKTKKRYIIFKGILCRSFKYYNLENQNMFQNFYQDFVYYEEDYN